MNKHRYVQYLARIFLLIVVTACAAPGCKFFNRTNYYKGEKYSIVFPSGWHKIQRNIEPTLSTIELKSPALEVVVVSPDTDLENLQLLKASIGVQVLKPSRAIWIEDELPYIKEFLEQSGYTIIEKGQIKIDEQIANWLLYYDADQTVLTMDFYIATEFNIIYRIQYKTNFDHFNDYRPQFEAAKDTFKFNWGF